MNPLAFLQHQETLRAQCPPASRPPEGPPPPIHVTTWGTGGEPVLIVHGGVQGGLGGGPRTFAGQEPLTEQGFELRLVDRPGFGNSPSRGPDDMEADAIWIADLLGEGAHLVGHSWGGAEALLAAARRPEAVRSLLLIEPALQPLLMTASDDPALAAGEADAGANVERLMQTHTPAEYGLAFARNLGGAEGDANAAAQALEVDPERAGKLGCALLQGRMAPPPAMYAAARALAAAQVPVLIVTGGWSPAFDAVGIAAARLAGGRHMVVPAPDHFPQLTAAAAFNSVAAEFWRSTPIVPLIFAKSRKS